MIPLSMDNSAVQAYFIYSAILVIKLLALAALTTATRLAKKVFANPDDAKRCKGVCKYDDPDVERVRRAHLNDLENIPAFWILGALYLTTGPSVWFAIQLFRIFTVGRVVHSLAYAVFPQQPTRAIAFGIPYVINLYMGAQVVLHYISAL